ncbi:MAG: RNA recognition motif domain-containing protein [Cytophagaceae bacterium]
MDIFVGSIPFKITEQELREIFEKHGQVSSVTIIVNKATRQNKGFAFVVMPNDKEAMDAIELLNGKEVMDRKIIVSKSEEKTDKERGRKKPLKDKQQGTAFNSGAPGTWPSKLFPKKKKPNVIGKYSDDEKNTKKDPKAGKRVKLAKNFKTGARKRKG